MSSLPQTTSMRRGRCFKPELTLRSADYRTPSPPLGAHEPISPGPEQLLSNSQPWLSSSSDGQQVPTDIRRTSGHIQGNTGYSSHSTPYLRAPDHFNTNIQYQHQSPQPHGLRAPQTPLDVFATLATSPALNAVSRDRSHGGQPFSFQHAHHSPHSYNQAQANGEPPYKKARSDVKPFTTPVQTGYHASMLGRHGSPTEASMEDAELLLSFVNAVKGPAHQFAAPLAAPVIPAVPVAPAPPVVEPEAVQVETTIATPTPPKIEEHSPQAPPPPGLDMDGNTYEAHADVQVMSSVNGLPMDDQDLSTFQPFPALEESKDDLKGSIEQKTRVYKGWPKGKPRGPRQTPYAKRGTKGSSKRSPQEGGHGQGSLSGSAGSPALSGVDGEVDDNELPEGMSLEVDQRISADGDEQMTGTLADELRDRMSGLAPDTTTDIPEKPKASTKDKSDDICAACQNARTSDLLNFWISCNGCKSWFHHTCVGFKTEREVKDVDKFYCKECEQRFGPTTFVRKSARAHASIDYAGLNEGKIRTSSDVPEHHYTKAIKEGTLKLQPETFPRMPPELVTAQYFERVGTMAEPIVIPAWMNPRPPVAGASNAPPMVDTKTGQSVPAMTADHETPDGAVEDLSRDFDYDYVQDVGQDKLDMVIPQGLTVRMVAELYGPEEKVEVIDVKKQEGEDKRWNMRQWADYYEATGQKPVRNVISLEVSQSKLGRLIRRPKIVRDLDLQDSVWPEEEQAKGIFPKVQFYCLMSVANCYTDFHIDFGGSSVYYHILQGQKTFFFIPPKKEHLKKYEEWCLSSEQNSIFLGDWTKECYRVDLVAGDTMMIPAGWIHAVWTPVDTLVIGGNFLTRMHYGMQIGINEIEKNTGVGRKFRYPHFQKVMWYAVVRYLERDPIPSSVAEILLDHRQFERKSPIWNDFDAGDESITEDASLYNEKYYSKGEIEGLADLLRYIFRTVMVSMGKVQGITKTTQEAVMRSMPKGYGDPLELAQTFAIWAAWKRGNEELPSWAYPDATLADIENGPPERKMTTAALKRMERQTVKTNSDRRTSARQSASTPAPKEMSAQPETASVLVAVGVVNDEDLVAGQGKDTNGVAKRACDACRKRRIRCKHKGDGEFSLDLSRRFGIKMIQSTPQPTDGLAELQSTFVGAEPVSQTSVFTNFVPSAAPVAMMMMPETITPAKPVDEEIISPGSVIIDMPSTSKQQRPRTKACDDCRKSKRRCIHDENGQIDPVRAQEAPVPRGSFSGAKRKMEGILDRMDNKNIKRESDVSEVQGMSMEIGTVDADSQVLEPSQDPTLHELQISVAVDDNVWNQPIDTTSDTTTQLLPIVATSITTSTKSRTPSFNDQTQTNTTSTESGKSGTVSTSPSASPLTDLNPTSPILQPLPDQNTTSNILVKEEFVPLRTPRQRKQVERFSASTYETTSHKPIPTTHHSPQTPKDAGMFAKPAQRKASGPSRSASREPSVSGVGVSPNGRGGRKSSAESVEEDESLRLARELSGQEFGLRRRSGMSM